METLKRFIQYTKEETRKELKDQMIRAYALIIGFFLFVITGAILASTLSGGMWGWSLVTFFYFLISLFFLGIGS